MSIPDFKEFDKISIDEETDIVLDKFAEGLRLVQIKGIIKNYLDVRFQQTFVATTNKEYKIAYYIYKKLEKVLIKALKNFNSDPDSLPNYSKVMLYLLDINQTVSQNEKLTILKLPTDIEVYPKVEDIDFFYYLLRCATQVINNIGVILWRRNKIKDAESYLIRALAARSFVLENHISQFQMGVLMENLAFILLNKGEKQDSKQFITKSLLIFEQLSQPQLENLEISINYRTMLNLVEMLYYSKEEEGLLQYPREIQKERMIHLLALTYNYFSEVFTSLNQDDQAKFCQQQFQFLSDILQKLNPIIQKRKKKSEKEDVKVQTPVDEQQLKIEQHKINLAQTQTLAQKKSEPQVQVQKDSQVDSLPPEISIQSLLFQRFIQIKDQRFKVIFLQVQNFLQIILYSKPLQFQKSLLIAMSDFLDLQKKHYPDSEMDAQKLEELFKMLIKQLYISKNELHIKEIKHFQSREEFQKVLNP